MVFSKEKVIIETTSTSKDSWYRENGKDYFLAHYSKRTSNNVIIKDAETMLRIKGIIK